MTELQQNLQEQHDSLTLKWGHLQTDRWQAVIDYSQDTVLDVGCANGIYVNKLHEINRSSYGIDLLNYEHWRNLDSRCFFGNALHLPFASEAFGTIISFETLEHVPNPEIALREYHRVCKTNIIISVPNCEEIPSFMSAGLNFNHWIDRTHTNFFTLPSLKDLVEENGFQVVEAKRFNHVLPSVPFFSMWGMSLKWAYRFGKVLNSFAINKYPMSLLVVARKI